MNDNQMGVSAAAEGRAAKGFAAREALSAAGSVQGDEYFAKRSLKKGSVGWILLVSLGVSYTISGDFSGWNYGMQNGGWWGMLFAFTVMGLMYLCTVFGLAELSSAIPTTGAGFGFARAAMGRVGGFVTGLALVIEYVCAPAAIATFIANYILELGLLPGVEPFALVVAAYVVFTGLHMFGVGEALRLMLVISGIAIVALILFAIGVAPTFDFSNIAYGAGGGNLTLQGALMCLPYGIWFFLGVEGVPLAAEESSDPRRDMPRGLIGALTVLALTGFSVLLLAAGSAGVAAIGPSDAPLVDALRLAGNPFLATVLNWAALAGLVASFFSLMYAGSRQVFALARSGYLPSFLALTGKRHTPWVALLASAGLGLAIVSVMHDGALILNVAVFGACVSYALMNLSHLILRRNSPDMERGYRTPGGTATTLVGLVLSCVAVVSTFFVDMFAAACAVAVIVAGLGYFRLYACRHLVANSPEEEFARLAAAEAELR